MRFRIKSGERGGEMKLIVAILITLIFILPVKSHTPDIGKTVVLYAIGGIIEATLVIGGTFVAINNTVYLLSTDRYQPSLARGYTWGALNLVSDLLICHYSGGDLSSFGEGQIVLSAIDIGTTILIHTKSKPKQLSYAPIILIDSNRKSVMGINIRLALN
jgi:hypothetical protein